MSGYQTANIFEISIKDDILSAFDVDNKSFREKITLGEKAHQNTYHHPE